MAYPEFFVAPMRHELTRPAKSKLAAEEIAAVLTAAFHRFCRHSV